MRTVSRPGYISTYCFHLSHFLLLLCTSAYAADINTDQIEKNHALESIRGQIRNVESSIDSARRNVETLFSDLQKNEIASANATATIERYQVQIAEKNKELADLSRQKAEQESLRNSERELLARQIRAVYKTGRSNYLKLLLNQQEPGRVGRVLAYYDYDVKARSARIETIHRVLTEISSLEQQIETESQLLQKLKNEQQHKLAELQAYRHSREEITSELQAYIEEQGTQLQILQANEQQLSKLVNQLEQQELVIKTFEEMPPFDSLQGQLDWPVQGRITSRFGSLRKGGKLKWQGVTITANTGVEVKAITTGKVVFADWFRNMGLLLIIDHGNGYMSLYGHNERLLRKPGDWVEAGEIIARVGDTGGQHTPGLYFEIRQGGNPINPTLWCRN